LSCGRTRIRSRSRPQAAAIDIGVLTFTNGPTSATVHISLGTAFFSDGRTPTQTVGRDLKGITTSLADSVVVELYGKIGRDFPPSGQSGTIQVDNLIRFDAVGTINGVVKTHVGTTDVTTVVCQKLGPDSEVRAETGDIALVRTTGNSASNGEIAGLVIAEAGNIAMVTTDYGDLSGSIHAPSSTTGQGHIEFITIAGDITSGSLINGLFPIRARHGIDSITAQSIDCGITARSDETFGSGTGRIGLLETTVGDFSGELACGYVGPSSGSPSYAIRIAGSLYADIKVDHAAGLEQQVIVNALDNSESWSGAVWLNAQSGPSTLYPVPYYDNVSSAVGGGAVGEVPFHLYKTDCDPPYDDSVGDCHITFAKRTWPSSHGGLERDTIIIRHYGPVFDSEDGAENPDDPDTKPLKIERRSTVLCDPTPCPGEEPTWTDKSDEYDVYVVGNGTANGIREV
jgi:hypothetical protein